MTSLDSTDGRKTKGLILSVLLCGNFVSVLDVFIVNVAIPSIKKDIGATNAEIQLILVAYTLVYGAMLLNGARLGDFMGRRRLFLAGMALFASASAICAASWSASVLIAARALQGLGAALMMPQVYASLRILFQGEERQRAFGIMGAVQGVAGVASQTLGGLLIALNFGHLGWRLVFLVNLPIAAYALLAGRWLIPETRAQRAQSPDLTGALLGICALLCLLLPLLLGHEQHWPPWMQVTLALTAPLLALFIWHEKRLSRQGASPIIEISLFRNPKFCLGIAIGILFYSSISSFALSLTILLQLGLGYSALAAAIIFLPSTVAFFIGALVSAPAHRRWGSGALRIGMTFFAAGLAGSILLGIPLVTSSPAILSVSVALQGLGQGLVIPILVNVVLSAVSDESAGMASGTFSVAQTVGSALGVAIVGAVLFSSLTQVVPPADAVAIYSTAFLRATLCNLAAVGIALLLLAFTRTSKAVH